MAEAGELGCRPPTKGARMQTDLGPGAVHPNHMENRLAYAQRIISFIDKHIPSAKAANLCVLNDASWYRIARLAGEANMPSKATISTVIGLVRGRELAIEAIQTSLGQPEKRLLSRFDKAPDPEESMV